jgi:hypothetical protein
MKKTLIIMAILTAIAFQSNAQYDKNVAIGIRIGEPLGLNIRKYFQYGDKAFDVNFGTYGFLYGTNRDYRKGKYQKSGLMFQGLYSWHYAIGKNQALKAYYGFGGQINYRDYASEENIIGTRQDGEKHVSLGPAGNAGVEYDLPGNDVGIFLDGGVYTELIPDLLFLHPQINAGIRVNLVRR